MSTENELLKLKTVLAVGVPPEDAEWFASRVIGETEDEILADAAKLAGMLGANTPNEQSRLVDHSQGRGGRPPRAVDPLLETLMNVVGVR
ncbi:hypothetical protein ACWF82_15160 [Nocardia sp. NPDC055053]